MNPGYVRHIMQLAFLAPDLVEAIVSHRLIAKTGVVQLTDSSIPMNWQEQRTLFRPRLSDARQVWFDMADKSSSKTSRFDISVTHCGQPWIYNFLSAPLS